MRERPAAGPVPGLSLGRSCARSHSRVPLDSASARQAASRQSARGPAYAAQILLLAGVYFGAAKLGLKLASANPSITAVWPPTGIALAALVLWGYRLWPGVMLGAALANALTAGTPALAVLGITAGNTLEALAGAYLLGRVDFRPSLERLRDVIALVALAALASTTISATIGVTSLWATGEIDSVGDLPSAWRVWWLGDMAGDLILAPFLFVLASGALRNFRRARLPEAGAVLGLLLTVSLIVFSRSLPMAYLIFPPLIWAALRFGQLGATLSGLIVATIAAIYTEKDLGPFARASADDSLLLSQTFTAVAVTTGLVLAAVTSERQKAQDELRTARDHLEETVEERTAEVEHSHRELELQALIARNMTEGVCLVRAADSRIVYVNPEFERMFGYRPGELNGIQIGTLNYRYGSTADAEAAAGIAEELKRAGEATYEVLNRHKDGTPFWSRVHTSSFNHPEHGDVWVAVHEDVTERKRAEILERSFVPERLPDIPGVQLAARFIPGGAGVEVGGDWYDVVELDGEQIALVIGDVAGRGVQAAAVMSQLRNGLRAFLFESHPPAVALQRLNTMAWSLEERVMATLVYLAFDPASGRLRLANAGHLPPLLIVPGGTTRYLNEGRSLPLGVRPATRYSEAEYVVEPGSTILLYTDGLVERRGITIDDGLARLARGAAAEHDGLDGFCDHILATLAPSGADDVALLALEPITLELDHLDLVLPALPGTLTSFRRALRRWLEGCGADEDETREIVLACNEAFSNAVEHAYGPADGEVETNARLDDGDVSVIVRDFGRWRAPRGENRGRGFALMEKLMDSVRVEKRQAGTEVRMTRTLKRANDGGA